MKRLVADPAEEETAKPHAVQPGLCVFRPTLIQFHAVGIAVVPLGQLPQRFAAAAAGIQQVRGDARWELNAA